MNRHILLIVILMSGCAELSVQVDILNPVSVREVAEEAELLVDYLEISRANSAEELAKLDRIRSSYQIKFNGAAESLVILADAIVIPDADDADEARQRSIAQKALLTDTASVYRVALQPDGPLGPLMATLASTIRNQNHAVRQVALQYPYTDNRLSLPLKEALRQRRNEIALASRELEKNVAALDVEAQLSQVTQELSRDLDSLTGGGSLVNSQYAHPVAAAAESQWIEKFDRAFGRAKFGDTDIILRMTGQGEFTVKGMQFDPSTVAAVASKVTTQSLLLAAQMAGVPVNTSSFSAADKKGFAAMDGSTGSIDMTLTQRQAKANAWKQTLRELANTILSEENEITDGDPNRRDAADKAIADQFAAYRELLKLADMQ